MLATRALILSVVLGVASACTPTSGDAPTSQVAQAQQERDELLAQIPDIVTLWRNGKAYKIGVHESRVWAGVAPVSPHTSATGHLLEDMVREVSGCAASFNGPLTKEIPGYTKDSVFPLRRAVRVDLSC